jgi:hypothetical protein
MPRISKALGICLIFWAPEACDVVAQQLLWVFGPPQGMLLT